MSKKSWITSFYLYAFFIALVFFSHSVWADLPGARPDLTPGMIGNLWRSHEQRIIKAIEDQPKLKERLEKEFEATRTEFESELDELYAQRAGAPDSALIRKTKSEYDEEINVLQQQAEQELDRQNAENKEKLNAAIRHLENLLSSPAREEDRKVYEEAPKHTAIRERAETYVAAVNAKEVMEELIDKLRDSPRDYDLAEQTYDKMYFLIEKVVMLNETFVDRINHRYLPEGMRLMERISEHRRIIEGDDGMSSALKQSELDRTERMEKNISLYLESLPEFRDMAEMRITQLKRQSQDITHLQRGAMIAGDMQSHIDDFSLGLEALNFDIPGTPEYAVDVLTLDTENL